MTIPPAEEGDDWPVLSEDQLNQLNSSVFGLGEDNDRLREAVLADYKAMTRKALKEVLIAEYRCRTKRCLLMHVWNTKRERCYYQPRYTLAPQVMEEESTESARQKRMSDDKWVQRAGFDQLLDFCGDEPDLGTHLNCAHVSFRITGRRLAADADGVTPGSPGDPILLPDDDTPRGLGGAFDVSCRVTLCQRRSTPGMLCQNRVLRLAAESAKAVSHAKKCTYSCQSP